MLYSCFSRVDTSNGRVGSCLPAQFLYLTRYTTNDILSTQEAEMRVIVSCVLQKSIGRTEIVLTPLVVERNCKKETVRDTIILTMNEAFVEMRKYKAYALISHSMV